MNTSSHDSESQLPQTAMPDGHFDVLAPKKTWVDTLSWYMLVMGFIGILTGGLMFWLYRSGQLRYEDYVLNGNVLGGYFLIAGISCYLVGRVLSHVQRLRRRRNS
jgi:hypothetical protein